MKNILFTSLRSDYEVITLAHMVNSYQVEYPGSEISLLVYEDQKGFAQMVSGVTKVYSIDRMKLKQLSRGKVYSDAFMLNEFFSNILEVITKQWDIVFNYSNDLISGHLLSFVEAKEKMGVTISEYGSSLTSNKWATFQNFACQNSKWQSIHPVFIRHHIASTPYYSEGSKIKINEEFSLMANKNFRSIREMKRNASKVIVVGVNLMASSQGDYLSIDVLRNIIGILEDSDEYKPILLHSGLEEEKRIVNKLNTYFNNELVSITADLKAMPSVLNNLDCLIGSNNSITTLADVLDLQLIELRSSLERVRTSNAINEGNYLIYHDGKDLEDEIGTILNTIFSTHLPVFQEDVSHPIYMTISDDYGLFRSQMMGPLNIQEELRYHIERIYHYQLLGYGQNHDLSTHLRENTTKEELDIFVEQTKQEYGGAIKVLLNTLRSLKGIKQSKDNLSNFVENLDLLIRKGQEDTLISAPIAMFEGNIENINSADINHNMKMIEKFLFDLKREIQLLANIIEELVSNNGRVERAIVEKEITL